MQFEKQPSGSMDTEAVGAMQAGRSYRREHKIAGGRPRFRGEGRSFAGDAGAVRHRSPSHDAMSGSAAGMSAVFMPGGYQHLAGVTMLYAPREAEATRLWFDPDTWWLSLGAALSWLGAQIVEGFALSASVTHSEFIWPLGGYLDGSDADHSDRRDDDRQVRTNQARAAVSPAEHAPAEHADVSHRPLHRARQIQPAGEGPAVDTSADRQTWNNPSWSTSNWSHWTFSTLAGLRSRVLRRREVSRIKTEWQAIDDRTLKDIGLSRYDVGLIVGEGRRWD